MPCSTVGTSYAVSCRVRVPTAQQARLRSRQSSSPPLCCRARLRVTHAAEPACSPPPPPEQLGSAFRARLRTGPALCYPGCRERRRWPPTAATTTTQGRARCRRRLRWQPASTRTPPQANGKRRLPAMRRPRRRHLQPSLAPASVGGDHTGVRSAERSGAQLYRGHGPGDRHGQPVDCGAESAAARRWGLVFNG